MWVSKAITSLNHARVSFIFYFSNRSQSLEKFGENLLLVHVFILWSRVHDHICHPLQAPVRLNGSGTHVYLLGSRDGGGSGWFCAASQGWPGEENVSFCKFSFLFHSSIHLTFHISIFSI